MTMKKHDRQKIYK